MRGLSFFFQGDTTSCSIVKWFKQDVRRHRTVQTTFVFNKKELRAKASTKTSVGRTLSWCQSCSQKVWCDVGPSSGSEVIRRGDTCFFSHHHTYATALRGCIGQKMVGMIFTDNVRAFVPTYKHKHQKAYVVYGYPPSKKILFGISQGLFFTESVSGGFPSCSGLPLPPRAKSDYFLSEGPPGIKTPFPSPHLCRVLFLCCFRGQFTLSGSWRPRFE